MSKLILAVDVSTEEEARTLCRIARAAGAEVVKMGLELLAAIGPRRCALIASDYGLAWVCDAKLHDIPQTVERAVRNLGEIEHAPIAITMHAAGGFEMMTRAQAEADKHDIRMLAVTVLTSVGEPEVRRSYHLYPSVMTPDYAPRVWLRDGIAAPADSRTWKVMEYANDAFDAGARGIVCGGPEVGYIKGAWPSLWAMVPGTRSRGAAAGDQKAIVTPVEALKAGADALVIGSQVTGAEQPHIAYGAIQIEIGEVPAA